MKKLFTKRALLVVYLESADLTQMEQVARGSGRTLMEWARDTLLVVLRPIAVSGKVCGHGVHPGDLCYRCDVRTGTPKVGTL